MADFKDFIKGFATTALANKGFDFRGVLANREKKGNKLDQNIEKANKPIGLGKATDTQNHNKKISEINRLYEQNKISKDDYRKRINEEVDSFNKLQENWKD